MRRWPLLALAVGTATAASMAALAPAQAAGRAAAQPGWRIWQVTGVNSATPDNPYDNYYSGITALSKNDAWAVGDIAENTKQGTKLTVKRWTGRSWGQLSLGDASSALAGGGNIGASSATNALVVGAGTSSSGLLRWNGKNWSVSHVTGATLVNGATFSATDAWAFGEASHTLGGYATHYNGRSWTKTSIPVVADMAGTVSAVGADDIWAVGVSAANPYGDTVETAYYNGRSWHAVPITNLQLPKNDSLYFPVVLALSAKNVWVYSWLQGFLPHAGIVPLSEVVLTHWNGKTWSRVTVPYATGQSGYIASDGHGGIWLSAYSTKGAPYLYHYNGEKWTKIATPTVQGYSAAVFALAAIGGTTSVWAAGELMSTANHSVSRAVIWKYGA